MKNNEKACDSLNLLKDEMLLAGSHLFNLGFFPGTSGNISVRLPDGSIIITPTGVAKCKLKRADLLHVDPDGNLLENSIGKPTSEMKMHLACYKERPDVAAVVHAHPPVSTGFAAAGVSLDIPVLPEAILILGRVRLVEYATPSTWEVPEKLKPCLPDNNAFLLANHGALTLGKNLDEAAHRMETLEFFAGVVLTARKLGGEKRLSENQVRELLEINGK